MSGMKFSFTGLPCQPISLGTNVPLGNGNKAEMGREGLFGCDIPPRGEGRNAGLGTEGPQVPRSREALPVFFMFVFLMSQVRYCHLHFKHREAGLRAQGLLGHVLLRGKIWT